MGAKKVYNVTDPANLAHKSSENSNSGSSENSSTYHNSHGISWFMAAVFIVGDMMGAGMIYLPLSLGRAGLIAGCILIILASLFSGYTGCQLGQNWEMMQNRWPKYRTHCRRPYPEMAYRALGNWARQAVAVCLVVSQFMIACVLILLSAENFTNLLNNFFGLHLDFCVFIVAIALVLWPFSLLQSPMDFWQLAVISAASSTVAAGLIVFGASWDMSTCVPYRQMPKFDLKQFTLSYGTIVFAFGGHGAFPTIQHDMAKPHQFSKSVIASYCLITLVYLSVSVTGLVSYGDSMIDTVIPSIQLTWVSQTINVLITAHILPTIIIVLSPLSQQVEEWIKIPNKFGIRRFLVRTLILGLTTFTALSVLKLGVFLDLVGATTITLMTMLLPSVFWLFMQASAKKREDGLKMGIVQRNSPDIETATLADVWYYTPKWILAFNIISLTFGLIGGISSAWSAIEELIFAEQVAPCYVQWFREGFVTTVAGGSVNCCGAYKNISHYGTYSETCSKLT
uniref:Aa_trans domain-containing protein n=1 Tax=Caenorhabditis japonica TaxID=281687 RepID=A0A8R1E1X8_CAEJA